ncbi:MAG: 1,4-dihydroxy-6-naphthoate synthase [Sphingomonadales bacterium]
MKIRIGFSPCPNDTYVFDAMVNQLIDTEGLAFEPYIEDVETLNEWALEDRLDVTKLSFPALFATRGHYRLLDSGAALGKGVGPLLVAKESHDIDAGLVNASTIALPGQHTTAHFLFSMAFPEALKKKFMLFADIEAAVLSSQNTMGVLIHENRFTYATKGLHKVMDLGTHWEQRTGVPIPLGGIAIKRALASSLGEKIQRLIAESLRKARQQQGISAFVKAHAQSMEPAIMQQHIDLYVNDYTLSLGSNGRDAIRTLYEVYKKLNGAGASDTPRNDAIPHFNEYLLNSEG